MQAGEKTIKLHLNREPRFYAWMVVDRSIWRTHDMANDVKMRYNEYPGGRGSQHTTDFYWTGIGVKKLVHPESGTGHWARVVKYPYPIIRLSDLYLMYAEAYNEYYGPGAEAYFYLNKVRETGGLRPIKRSGVIPPSSRHRESILPKRDCVTLSTGSGSSNSRSKDINISTYCGGKRPTGISSPR